METCQNQALNGGGYYFNPQAEAYISGAGTGVCDVAVFTTGGGLIGRDFYDGNEADNSGGAIIAGGADVEVVNHGFFANQALSGNGGAIFAQQRQPDALIINAIFYANLVLAGDGGAIYNGSSLSLYHNTLRDNVAPFGAGGAIYHNGGALVVNSSIFYTNTANAATGGGLFSNTGGGTFDYNLFYQNSPDDSNVGVGNNAVLQDPRMWLLPCRNIHRPSTRLIRLC